MTVFLSGCMKTEVTYNVSSDGSVEGSMKFLMAESFLTQDGSDLDQTLEEMKTSFLKDSPGAKGEIIREKDGDTAYAGVKITGMKSEDIKAVKEGNQLVLEVPVRDVENSIAGGSGMDTSSITPAQLKSFGCSAVMIINMPASAESNYGTVEGKKVTVDLLSLPAEAETVRVTCAVGGGFPLWIIAAAAALAGAAVFFFRKKKLPVIFKQEDKPES